MLSRLLAEGRCRARRQAPGIYPTAADRLAERPRPGPAPMMAYAHEISAGLGVHYSGVNGAAHQPEWRPQDSLMARPDSALFFPCIAEPS